MRNLIFSYLLLLVMGSCCSYNQSFTKVNTIVETYTPNYLTDKNIEKVFRININIYDHDLSGILAIKKINEEHYRVAVLTEIGAKLIDFELIKEQLKLNYAIEQLNRKIILNVFKRDFLLLLNQNTNVVNQYEYKEYTVYESLLEKKSVYYYISKQSDNLEKTVYASKKKSKISLDFVYNKSDFPDVEIRHNAVKLQINLKVLEN
ncbi:hypothetical protein O2K51_10215 [Apibacter raozihei]|uniref:hypothetical protein n=1 Tax=Apibacter raozihei TaxID=2500547 RepID=UPI000FE3858E|nr:hypothetical protein [Apibacter raozihei]